MKAARSSALRVLAGAVAVTTMSLGVAACSTDDGGDAASSEASSESSSVYPVSVDTKFGEVTIEQEPERVVALGWGDAETALELGVQPVGASDWLDFGGDGVGPWIEQAGESYDEAPEIIGTMEPDFEAIAALDPDLILDVRSSGDQDRYDTLSQIAPTVGVPDGGDSYLTPKQTQVEMIATALGKAEEGEKINREYEDTVAQIREDHPQWSEMTVAAVSATADSWGAYIKGSNRVDSLLDLGFRENPVLADEETGDTGFSVKLSDETLSKADSDLVVGFAVGISAEDMADEGSWKRLKATEEGRSFVMPEEISSAFALGSPQSTRFALEKLVPLLEEYTKQEN
jgi:iron complex transport system substrate-binding protein